MPGMVQTYSPYSTRNCVILEIDMPNANPIRDFPDHATFREKGAKLDCADKLGVFLSLTPCIKSNFDPLLRIKYDGLEKM